MKKIVMGIAAVACAASMFAADVSAKLVFNTNLYKDKAILTNPDAAYDVNNTHFKLSVGGDASGASIVLTGKDVAYDEDANVSLWFKPVDSVKVTVGALDTGSLNRGTFAWWHRTARVNEGKNGVMVNANVGPVALEIASFNNALLNFANSGYAMLGDFWAAGTFGVAGGNMQVFATKGAAMSAYGVGGWESASLGLGVAFDHMPWQQTGYYADAMVDLAGAKSFNKVVGQIGGQYCANGIALRLSNMLAFGQSYGNGQNAFKYGFVAKAEYATEAGWTPYLQVVANEIMDKKFSMDAGVTKSFGAAGINARFSGSYDGSAFAWSIPCEINIAF